MSNEFCKFDDMTDNGTDLFRRSETRLNIPLSPACATFFAKLCNPITCQPLELESCSNPLRIQQVF